MISVRVYVITMRGFFFFDKTMRGSVPLYRKQSDQTEALFLHKSN